MLQPALVLLALVAALYLGRRVLVAGPRAPRVDLRGKTVVVTGASPGSIGGATARELADWGARVIITTRSRTAEAVAAIASTLAEPEARARVTGHPLDLCDPASVETFARWVREETGGHLDVLVNNAGVHLDLLGAWKEPHLAADGHEIHYRTNFLGTMHLTLALLPLLRGTAAETGEARVVNVVSHLQVLATNADLFGPLSPYGSWRAYGRSKLAMVHATFELARRFGAEGLHATCLHPGSVASHIADAGLADHGALVRLRRSLSFVERFVLKSPTEGAQTTLVCATTPDLPSGVHYERCRPKAHNPEADDAAVGARVYALAEAWVRDPSTAPPSA